jgi:hypothetical protein
MAAFLRFLLGVCLLPLCWAFLLVFIDAVSIAGEASAFSAEVVALLGGIAAFVLCWTAITRPVRAYVLGHELTHALWGLLFGARPSDLKVGAEGGSVKLTKTNVLITLAPFFFPFYTFLVIVVALITYAFLRPLPYLPLWMFLIGFTWAFHVLFTMQTLSTRQPDVKIYGRVFSWSIIFLANLIIVLIWLACATSYTFSALYSSVVSRSADVYLLVGSSMWRALKYIYIKIQGE